MKKHGLVAAIGLLIFLPLLSVFAQTSDPDFGGVNSFGQKWIVQDRLVGSSSAGRPYTWGPKVPNTLSNLMENYKESANGKRRVLYFDKARMEINDAANNFVTTGLAVKELVSGLRQDGDNTFLPLTPSQTQVAGDPVSVNPNAPTYASFKNVVTLGNADDRSKPSEPNMVINSILAKDGKISELTPPENIIVGAYEVQTGHNIAKPFVDFKGLRGTLTDPKSGANQPDQPIFTDNPTSNVFGLAISEPYWVRTLIGGAEQIVLTQLFERRVLTYNPSLSTNKVEMGNLGQHYYQWRYLENSTPIETVPPIATTPLATTPVTTNTPTPIAATSTAAATPIATTPIATVPVGGGTPMPIQTVPPIGIPTPVVETFDLNAEELGFLTAINQYRASKGKSSLRLNQKLVESARWLSTDMGAKNYFNHIDSLGRDFVERIVSFGYPTNIALGEDIAAGYETSEAVLGGWQNSPSHDAVMLGSNYNTIGISRVYNQASIYKWYWTIDLGGE